jgi:DNA-binding NarL/FixJ family response regulator
VGTVKLDATLEQLGWESSVAENAAASSRVGEQGMPKAPPIRVLICDDHRILSDAMAMLIGMESDLELVAEPFERAAPAIAAVAEFAPDVVLMDVELPGGTSGIEATRTITEQSPRTKVVVMSGSSDPDQMLVDAIGAGAAGFMPKTEAATKILGAVRAAASGESLLDSATLARVLRRVADARAVRQAVDRRKTRLTERERVILQRMSEGVSNDDIAGSLFLSIHTVHTHVRNILVKLEVHSKLQAVALAVKAGVIIVKR